MKKFQQLPWRHWIPAGLLLTAGFIVVAFPIIATLIVAGALFAAGIVYAWIVWQVTQLKREADEMAAFDRSAWVRDINASGEPSFRNISVRIFRRPKRQDFSNPHSI